MQVLNNVDTKDNYDDALRLEDDLATHLTILAVANASVIAKFRPARRQGGSDESYGNELLLTPQAQPIPNVSGVEFRSAVAGQPGRIVAALLRDNDPFLTAGIPFTGTLAANGSVTGASGVSELAYSEFTATVPIAATTEATANQIVAAPQIDVDGVKPIIVEAYIPKLEQGGAAVDIALCLFDGGSSIGQMAVMLNQGSRGVPVMAARRFLPLSGAHTFSIRAFLASASAGAQAEAGPGGGGNLMPGFLRIST